MVGKLLARYGLNNAACGHRVSLLRAYIAANGQAATSFSYEGWLEIEVGTVTGIRPRERCLRGGPLGRAHKLSPEYIRPRCSMKDNSNPTRGQIPSRRWPEKTLP